MENGLYIGLSRQLALQKKMQLVSNNIANVNTPGFRADKILFEEYVYKTNNENHDRISMVLDYGQYKDTAAGQISFTGNAYDVALQGPGYMSVETATGTKYTRAGNFAVNGEGLLVTPTGNPVLDDGGGRITIPEDVKDIKITKDGQIVTDQGALGTIGMFEFDNPQMLRPTGDGFYEVTEGAIPLPAENTVMKQGMIESSNVKAVLEMTDLIEISRQYQSNQRNLQNEHERQLDTIEKLSAAN